MKVFKLAAITALAAIIAASFVFVVSSFAAHAPDHHCSIASDDDFYATIAAKNAKLMIANDTARNIIIDAVNADRKAKGMFLIEADTFVVGLFSEGGMMRVGLVAFKDHCVVPGTVAVMDAQKWVGYMLAVGISTYDFTEFRNG